MLRPTPGDHPAEQVARHLVRGQPPGAAGGAGDAVLGLQTVDAAVHPPSFDQAVAGQSALLVRSSRSPSSSRVRSRSSPDLQVARAGPDRSRSGDSRRTGCPTASMVRRTIRFRPSCNVIRTSDFSAGGGDELDRVGPDRAVLEGDALPQPLRIVCRRDHARDLGQVGLRHLVRRVGQPVREVAVVGQDQQALGVGVQPADVEQPLLAGRRLPSRSVERAPALRVVHGRDHAARLVEHQVEVPPGRRDPGAVDPDDVAFRDRPAGPAR